MKVGDYVYCKKDYKFSYRNNEKYLIVGIESEYFDDIDDNSYFYRILSDNRESWYFLLKKTPYRHYFYDVFYSEKEMRNKKLKSL